MNNRYTKHSYSPLIFPSLPSLSVSLLITQPCNIHNSQSRDKKAELKLLAQHENTKTHKHWASLMPLFF